MGIPFESSLEVFTEYSNFVRWDGVLFFYIEQGKDFTSPEFVRQVSRFGYQMKVDMMKVLGFRQADRVFFLAVQFFEQETCQPVLEVCQFQEFLSLQLMQGLDMPLEHQDQPTLELARIGVLNQPEFAGVDGWPGRDPFLA
jgi:hypothetical protein